MATTTVTPFAFGGGLLDSIAQAAYDNEAGLVNDGASTDDIAALFGNPKFIENLYQHVSNLKRADIELSEEEKEALFDGAIKSFAKLFEAEIDDYSLDMSAHRPPFIEFTAPKFEGGVSLTTWRHHKGGYDGELSLTAAPTEQELLDWSADNDEYGFVMHSAYISARNKMCNVSDAFMAAMLASLDIATS